MAPDVFARDCASRLVLDRIGDKWSVLVVLALSEGPLRFSVLRKRMEGVTPKVLTQTLRALERDGILTRAGERWIVSPLDALASAECIRGIGELEACLEVLVREDAEFGVTVARFTIADHVTMASPRQAEHLLDDAALAAYAACLAEELMRGASATSA